jgi:AAHS family 4-hydroxybenzoate transporter-like MFS transporter
MTTPARAAAVRINPADVLENSRIGSLQIRVFILCMISLIMDGFDVQALGYVGAPIVAEFGVPPSALGAVFSIGKRRRAHRVARSSARWPTAVGRRPVIVGMTLFFSAMTLLTAQSQSLTQLLLAALDLRDRPRLDHAERDRAHRRVQPGAQARDG